MITFLVSLSLVNGSCGIISTAQNLSNTHQNHYDWSTEEQGLVLGAWFYGFVASQIIGGILADRYSYKVKIYSSLHEI